MCFEDISLKYEPSELELIYASLADQLQNSKNANE